MNQDVTRSQIFSCYAVANNRVNIFMSCECIEGFAYLKIVLPPLTPLFTNNLLPHKQVIDTHIHDALKKVLTHRNISHKPHVFHKFRRSGAIFAFDHNMALQNIIPHGLWRSSAIWTYLQNASQAASIIPQTFTSNIPYSFYIRLGALIFLPCN